jgi:hypothetical protein
MSLEDGLQEAAKRVSARSQRVDWFILVMFSVFVWDIRHSTLTGVVLFPMPDSLKASIWKK